MPNGSRSWTRSYHQLIHGHGGHKERADEGVALEEGAVDPGEIELSRAAMFVDQGRRHKRHRRVIDRPQFRDKAERNEAEEHKKVHPLRQTQAPGYA